MNLYRKITIEIDEGNHVRHLEMSNEELLHQITLNKKLNSKCKRLQKLLDFEIERNDIKQDKIDKVIEYIQVSNCFNHDKIELVNGTKIRHILQGSDKDV